MKINNQTTDSKLFAYDGCHKIYLIESEEEKKEVEKTSYKIKPIEDLPEVFKNSCPLRFISNWSLTKQFVTQFEGARFKTETEATNA